MCLRFLNRPRVCLPLEIPHNSYSMQHPQSSDEKLASFCTIHDTGAGSAAISFIVDAPRGASTYRHQGLHAVVDLLSTNHNIIVAVTSSGYGPKQLGQRSMGGKVEGWQSTDWSHVDDLQACRSVLDEVLLCSKRSPRKDLQNASCRRPTAGKPLQ
ncbi:hypothetical protein BDP67DRAFT_495108 [Colletotrichum lupini]|nr:hypothetical protein BDP67DRAFT_495108 [Colletotrichum lupini]